MTSAASEDGMEREMGQYGQVRDVLEQEADSIDRSRRGSGAGLGHVRTLVRLLDGEVEVRSDVPGERCEIASRLPLRGSTGTYADLTSSESAHSQEKESFPAASCNILVVDDNVDAADSLSEFLKANGHLVHIAHDGTNAIATASAIRPDVILLDIGLPGMNGYQVAKRLRADAALKGALLVALTGYTQERDRTSAKEAGFDDHFAKPLDLPRLLALLAHPRTGGPTSTSIAG